MRVLTIPWQQARGPVWARFLIQRQLLRDEDYYLQIDSHTRMAAGWDEALLAMLSRCSSPKPVLTTYPLPYDGDGAAATCSRESRLTVLCSRAATEQAFGTDGMLRFRARLLDAPPATPPPSAFWAAGFSFSSAQLVAEVPYDPHLPFLFFGEEVTVAVRMWTRGWDLFAPDAHVLFHKWERGHRKGTFWEVPEGARLKRESQVRVRRLLTGRPLSDAGAAADEAVEAAEGAPTTALITPVEDGGAAAHEPSTAIAQHVAEALAGMPGLAEAVWGVGTIRSLRSYEAFSGVDFGAMRVSAQAERGGMPEDACFWDRFASLDAWLEARTSPGAS